MSNHVFYSLALRHLGADKSWFVSPWEHVRLEKRVLALFSKDQLTLFTEVLVCSSVKEWTLIYSGPEEHAHHKFVHSASKLMVESRPLCGDYSFKYEYYRIGGWSKPKQVLLGIYKSGSSNPEDKTANT